MTMKEAINLVNELVDAEVALVHAANSRRGCKGALKREKKAAHKLLRALTNQKPTEEDTRVATK